MNFFKFVRLIEVTAVNLFSVTGAMCNSISSEYRSKYRYSDNRPTHIKTKLNLKCNKCFHMELWALKEKKKES
jgi:hypothetical protein